MLHKLQKCLCRVVDFVLATSIEPLCHLFVASLSHFNRHYFVRCLSLLAELVSLPYCCGSSTCYSNRLQVFSGTIARCYKNSVPVFTFLILLDSVILFLQNVFLVVMI